MKNRFTRLSAIILTALIMTSSCSKGVAPSETYDAVTVAVTVTGTTTVAPVTTAAIIETLPETTAFSETEPVITVPEIIEKPTINHQIPQELMPFFNRANRVLALELAGHDIANESGRHITIKYSDNEFFARYDNLNSETVGLYRLTGNEIHLKGIKNTNAIYHEMIHERTVMFMGLFSSHGLGFNEGLTSLLTLELFDVQCNYFGERRIVKMLTEILGFENVILPFINRGYISDITRAIDAAYGETGYGKKNNNPFR